MKRPLTKIDNADRLVRLTKSLGYFLFRRRHGGTALGRQIPERIKLGPKATCWRLSEITALAERGVGDASTR